jgi:ubiquinone/menaquinone biosynthesis C-methylase UbiE
MGLIDKPQKVNIKTNADVLPSLVDLKNRKVADVGCGDGSLVRLMARHGAKVIGVECNLEMLERARSAKPAGEEFYCEGVGENLPFDDGKLDLIVFFNSLHHVAVDHQDQALGEAARVLKRGGQVYICEPVAEGPHFEMMKPVHDETDVRTGAYKAIKEAGKHGLDEELETTYVHPSSYADFQALQDQLTTINPHLKKVFASKIDKIRGLFDQLGHKTAKGIAFDQPMRVNLMRKK